MSDRVRRVLVRANSFHTKYHKVNFTYIEYGANAGQIVAALCGNGEDVARGYDL